MFYLPDVKVESAQEICIVITYGNKTIIAECCCFVVLLFSALWLKLNTNAFEETIKNLHIHTVAVGPLYGGRLLGSTNSTCLKINKGVSVPP